MRDICGDADNPANCGAVVVGAVDYQAGTVPLSRQRVAWGILGEFAPGPLALC
ncbi:MAG: hypothetical protein ISS45_08050, partial [Candidatus Omnitrophica bacterium]|nr:hypothetical protein [Candidatus Omnitrophota bacterium]